MATAPPRASPVAAAAPACTFGGIDTIRGGYGDDRVSGGHGTDRLSGGSGADILAFGNHVPIDRHYITPGIRVLDTGGPRRAT